MNITFLRNIHAAEPFASLTEPLYVIGLIPVIDLEVKATVGNADTRELRDCVRPGYKILVLSVGKRR